MPAASYSSASGEANLVVEANIIFRSFAGVETIAIQASEVYNKNKDHSSGG